MTLDRDAFETLAAAVCTPVTGTDRVLLSVAGETSDFVRFNRARIRQMTRVDQVEARLSVVRGQRRADATVTLTGRPDDDRQVLLAWRSRLVDLMPQLPDDPHLRLPDTVRNTTRDDLAAGATTAVTALASVDVVVDQVLAAADGNDFVGFHAAGPLVRAFADSRGQRNWHRVESFSLDWSLHLTGRSVDHDDGVDTDVATDLASDVAAAVATAGSKSPPAQRVPRRLDRAVKAHYADTRWRPEVFAARMAEARIAVERLARPAIALPPGAYRTWLAPEAMADLLGMLAWGGFAEKARRTGTSPLGRLSSGDVAMAPGVQVAEDTARGIAPRFTDDGDVTPDRVALVADGRDVGSLISPRSAAEYGLVANAGDGEHPSSLSLAAGGLPTAEASLLAAIGDGLWIGNLWYLNYSDRNACRMTGMTRFACFRVQGGRITAPIEPMRFDDALTRLLGPALLGLGDDARFMPSSDTWGNRHLQSVRAPGGLVEGLRFTL